MRNYGWVDLFKGHYLVARNGGCTFKVYDLQQKNVCENLSGVWKTVFTLWAAPFWIKKLLSYMKHFLPERILKQKKLPV